MQPRGQFIRNSTRSISLLIQRAQLVTAQLILWRWTWNEIDGNGQYYTDDIQPGTECGEMDLQTPHPNSRLLPPPLALLIDTAVASLEAKKQLDQHRRGRHHAAALLNQIVEQRAHAC